ncbi:MAG: Binding-protein-dependent transport system inner membrane component [Microgenomates group bacterium GW2011_GWA2_40_6]|nr:MAG: Binding-protein-dependent transport system inner membrane component [Microgenomates group bacterium GW2011_GWA2_40_6]
MSITGKKKNGLIGWVGPLVLITIWAGVNLSGLVDSLYLPNVGEVAKRMVEFLSTDGWRHISSTLTRTLLSIGLATVIGVPLGLIIGLSPQLYQASEIIIDFFRSVPGTAFFPLFLLFFGVGDEVKIAITSFVVSWVMLLNSVYGVWNCPKTRMKIAKVFRASRWQIFREVIIFDALPQIVVGLRLSLSLALVITIVTEMYIGGNYGLGRKIYDSYIAYDTAKLYAIILVIGGLGLLINKSFGYFERKVVHWAGK